MTGWLRYLWGLHRLHFGFCPACNSSPPRRDCPVCEGDHNYGRHDEHWNDLKAERWRQRWRMVARGRP